jgi:hypothetical protein
MTSSFSWRWARVDDPLATSSRATLIFSPCAKVRRYNSVTASGCIEFQSYTCMSFTFFSQSALLETNSAVGCDAFSGLPSGAIRTGSRKVMSSRNRAPTCSMG